MKKFLVAALVVAFAFVGSGCQRIETGEIGLRVGFDKQVQKTELQPGSFNQTLVGDVLVFPIREIGMKLDGLTPQTKDNSTLSTMEVTVVYGINSAAAFDIYTTKAHTLNAIDNRGETLLMYNYIHNVANNAVAKAVNKYDALTIQSHRTDIENDVKAFMTEKLAAEKLDMAVNISNVQVGALLPSQSIIDSANAVITAQNAQKAALVAVGTAKLEADRNEYLSRPTNITYMKAKAELNISEAALEGKVNTILIPHGMTMFGGTGK